MERGENQEEADQGEDDAEGAVAHRSRERHDAAHVGPESVERELAVEAPAGGSVELVRGEAKADKAHERDEWHAERQREQARRPVLRLCIRRAAAVAAANRELQRREG